ncbi:MAG: hypothetical protein IT331_14945 [Anaerolineae bacterium]|nr:hypothetical protein [Anaerolineae bacterium]
MYVMVRQYVIDPGRVDEIMRLADEEYLPRVESSPGFVAYYVMRVSADVVATVSIYQEQSQMEAASRAASDWVRENLAPLFPNEPLVIAGDAPAFRARQGK